MKNTMLSSAATGAFATTGMVATAAAVAVPAARTAVHVMTVVRTRGIDADARGGAPPRDQHLV